MATKTSDGATAQVDETIGRIREINDQIIESACRGTEASLETYERLLRTVKEREARGYSYDGAEASFVILARDTLGTLPEFFEVESYRASVERRHRNDGRSRRRDQRRLA